MQPTLALEHGGRALQPSGRPDCLTWECSVKRYYPLRSSANLGSSFPVLLLEAAGGQQHSGTELLLYVQATGHVQYSWFRESALKILWVLQGRTGYLLWLRLFCVAQCESAFDSREVVCRPAMQAVSLEWNHLPMVYWTFCNDYVAAEKLKT